MTTPPPGAGSTSFYSGGTDRTQGYAGEVDKGTLKTIDGFIYQYDPSRGWYNTGVRDTAQQGGLTFDQQMQLKQTPSVSFSSSTSQSLADPRTLALQQAQLDETIRQNQASEANARATQEFLQQKEAFAESQDNKRLANETSQQLFNNSLSLQNLQSQHENLQAQRDQFNMQMGLQYQQAALQFENDRQNRIAKANEDAAQFAQNPTDYGKLAAFQLANRGWGAQNTAQTTADLTSNESLQPLAGALNQRKEAQAAQNPFASFTPLPALAPLDLSRFQAQQAPAPAQGGGGLPTYAPQQLTPTGAAPNPNTPPNPTVEQANASMAAAGVPSFVPKFADGGAVMDPNTILMMFAKVMGMEPKAIAGEKGKKNGETVMSNGDVVVIPDKGKAMKKPKMADGGAVIDLSQFGAPLDTTEANQFRMDAFQKALAGTPYASGGLSGLPTSVYASSPGFSPSVQALIASLNSIGKGIPANEFNNQTQMLTPLGYNQQYGHTQQIIGRSA